MADEKYIRWQGQTIGQFSVAIALISGLSLAGLGAGFSAIQSEGFHPVQPWRGLFFASLFCLLLSLLFSSGAVITRLLDFRLTARKVRKDKDADFSKPLTMFRSDKDAYSEATWRLFWLSCVVFLVGLVLLIASLANIYISNPSSIR